MCGIAGFTTLKPRASSTASRMRELLRHRGPDQQGIYEGQGATLCATRLKIVDLNGGDQPLTSEDGDCVIAFNGEIYNHREIRSDLEDVGHRFRSDCDTETVLRAFLEWDTECFTRMRGMFAVALWKERSKRLVLVRDRIGIKPLYYALNGIDLHFGSELKAILAHSDIPRHISPEALDRYLSVNYVPGDRTLIEAIRKIPPGCVLEWQRGVTRIEPWWTPPNRSPKLISLGAAKEELDYLLTEATREHMAADVPVGIWASGGLDSSTILHYAAQHSSTPLKTFSVSFSGRDCDESRYFREVARVYGTNHEEFDLNPGQDLTETVQQLAYYSDEPSADSGALPVWYLSRLSRRHVTVALSGEGADELFGGYITYLADRLAPALRATPVAVRKFVHRSLDRYIPVSNKKISLEYKLKRWIEGSLLHPDEAHFFWNGTFSPSQLSQIRPGTKGSGLLKLVDGLALNGKGTERYLQIDQRFYLADDILYKTDRMSMAHALEVRPPFLDHRIVEFAASLPEELKIRRFTQKVLLRELMRDRLPPSILTRPKTGFDIPTHEWFRGPLKPLLMDTLTPRAIEGTGIFDSRAIESLIRDHMERRINAGYHLWGLLTLFLWIRRWKVETLPEERAIRRASAAALAAS